MKNLTRYAVLTMALLFTIYSQIKIELYEPGLVYLYEVMILLSLVLTLFVYQIQKRNDRNDFSEHLSTAVKVSVVSFLLYIPLNFMASIRLIDNATTPFLGILPKILADIIINSFFYIPIIILATILSYAVYWIKYERRKG